MKDEPDETAILDMLSQADKIFRSFDIINETRSRYPKIDNAVNLYIDWEIEISVDDILNILIKHTEYMQKEILSSWATSNPSSKVLSYY